MSNLKSLSVLFLILSLTGCTGEPDPAKQEAANEKSNLAKFATCLSTSGAKFYGAEWCGHCKNQKALFQENFQHINYIDCDKQKATCQQLEITSYPTWILGNGKKLTGSQGLQNLAQSTGCKLVEEKPATEKPS